MWACSVFKNSKTVRTRDVVVQVVNYAKPGAENFPIFIGNAKKE
jgi:hypothetical protein